MSFFQASSNSEPLEVQADNQLLQGHLILFDFLSVKFPSRVLLLFTDNYREVSGVRRSLLLYSNGDHYRNGIRVP